MAIGYVLVFDYKIVGIVGDRIIVKKYNESAKLIDRSVQYDANEAISLVKKAAVAKFDETIEAHIRLGVDGRHADQQVRGAVARACHSKRRRQYIKFSCDR